MPATAAIDNETLDHLLSVVNNGSNIEAPWRFGRRDLSPIDAVAAQYEGTRRYLPSSRIAPSSPSSVSGNIRLPMICRIRRIEAVMSHSCSATGLSQTQDG